MMDAFTRTIRRGDRGPDVRLAQEWLTFHGCATAVDGWFGPATERAAEDFQVKEKLPRDGVVGPRTQASLLRPIQAAQQPIAAGGRSIRALYIAYARQHLRQHPIEIGGQNRGPWVRLYMGGREGPEWPWCAGFATWVLRQAAQAKGVATPHSYGFSCDVLAMAGKARGALVHVRKKGDFTLVKPGFLFLIRRTAADWTHVGIVEDVLGETMTTIEGNTNDRGSREGFEVCRRTRSLMNKDYLVV